MIDVMDDDQLREYLKNRPDDLKTVKSKAAPSKRVRLQMGLHVNLIFQYILVEGVEFSFITSLYIMRRIF